MISLQNPECSCCGSRKTIVARQDLIRDAADGYDELEGSTSEFVQLSLHAIGLHLFGGMRFRCRDCGEVFGVPARSKSSKQIQRSEVCHLTENHA